MSTSSTHPVLMRAAQLINQDLSDADRNLLLLRLLGTGRKNPVLATRLALWAAQRVAHLNPDPRVTTAVEAAELWVESPRQGADPMESYCWDCAHDAYAAACRDDATSAHSWEAAYAAAYAAGYTAKAAAYAAASNHTYAATAAAAGAVTYAVDAITHEASDAGMNASGTNIAAARVKFLADLITEYDRLAD